MARRQCDTHLVWLVHTHQDKDNVILIIYNQLDAITWLKCKVKFILFSIKLHLYLKNLILKKWDNTPDLGSNSNLKISQVLSQFQGNLKPANTDSNNIMRDNEFT
jgi:hypothetical protein